MSLVAEEEAAGRKGSDPGGEEGLLRCADVLPTADERVKKQTTHHYKSRLPAEEDDKRRYLLNFFPHHVSFYDFSTF